jgi:hypothetical protein
MPQSNPSFTGPTSLNTVMSAERARTIQHHDAPPDPNYSRSVGVGVALGLVVGTLAGVAMLLYVDSVKLNHWPGVTSLVVSSAFGWALFGMIVGSGGIFSNLWRRNVKRRLTVD